MFGVTDIKQAPWYVVNAEDKKTARLNVIRLGMHYCIPWRVTGALAIGSCIVLDR